MLVLAALENWYITGLNVRSAYLYVVFKGLVWSGFFPFLRKTETEPVLEILKFSHDWTEPSQTGLYQSSISCQLVLDQSFY